MRYFLAARARSHLNDIVSFGSEIFIIEITYRTWGKCGKLMATFRVYYSNIFDTNHTFFTISVTLASPSPPISILHSFYWFESNVYKLNLSIYSNECGVWISLLAWPERPESSYRVPEVKSIDSIQSLKSLIDIFFLVVDKSAYIFQVINLFPT